MIAKANRTKEIVRAMNKNPSLALKANVTHSKAREASKEESVEEDLEEEGMTSTSELDTDLAFFAKKYRKHSMKRGSFVPKEKRRSCYNCDEPGHFADSCPYEKRQDKLKYIKGAKPKLKPNPINLRNKNKFKDINALVGVEYTSDVDEEDSDEEDIVGVAGLALAKPGALFRYDYTKDYEISTKNTHHKCFIAKEAKGYSSGGPKWLFDSGCTNHMTRGREVLEQFVEDVNSTQCILSGDNSKGKVLGRGKLAISMDFSLENVMLVDTLGYNLLSICHLASIGYDCYFTYNHMKVFRSDNLKLVCVGHIEDNLYVVDFLKENTSSSTCLISKVDEGWLWHRQLGHINMRNLK
jgi:hypothetical protein